MSQVRVLPGPPFHSDGFAPEPLQHIASPHADATSPCRVVWRTLVWFAAPVRHRCRTSPLLIRGRGGHDHDRRENFASAFAFVDRAVEPDTRRRPSAYWMALAISIMRAGAVVSSIDSSNIMFRSYRRSSPRWRLAVGVRGGGGATAAGVCDQVGAPPVDAACRNTGDLGSSSGAEHRVQLADQGAGGLGMAERL